MKFKKNRRQRVARKRRAGSAALDYALLLGMILPLMAFIMRLAPKTISLVYEMTALLISWPFM